MLLCLALALFEAVEAHMGTLVRIQLYARDAQEAQAGFRAAFDRIAAIDAALSDYRADSEVNRLTSGARVSEDLRAVLDASQRLAEDSGGAFDVTVGPLTRLWRGARKARRLPDREALRSALARCGYRKLHLHGDTVTMDEPLMQLDFGGIAKGYAADQALSVLARMGIRSALIAASGDLTFSDAPPGRKGWNIGLGGFDQTVELANAAVSTSGTAEQHLDLGGKRYSHIIDPRTGMALDSDITVTVIAPTGMEADGLATAISVLGRDDIARGRPGVRCYIRNGRSGMLQSDLCAGFSHSRSSPLLPPPTGTTRSRRIG